MRLSRLTLSALLLLVVAPSRADAQAGRRVPPDLILTGGKVFTADPARPWAEAIAVRGERIVAVGRTAEIERLAGSATRRIPLGGRLVIPGINDAHVHLGSVALGTVVAASPGPPPDPTLRAVLDSVRAVARRAPRGRWIAMEIGLRVLDDPRLRTGAILDSLDRAAPANPVLLEAGWGHGTIVNGAGLRRLEIDAGMEPPFGGWYGRVDDDRLTGELHEYAAWRAIRSARSALPAATLARALRRELAELAALGITSVQNMASALEPAATIAAIRSAGSVARVRLVSMPMPDADGVGADEWEGIPAAPAPLVELSGTKWILDGTPLERLAMMRAPYADAGYTRGRLNQPPEVLRALLARHARMPAGPASQLMLHVVGDSAARLVLTHMRAIAPDSTWRARRVRIEHGDWMTGDLLPVARRLGVIVVQNPVHFALPPGVVEARYGRRAPTFQTVRALAAAGVPLAFGSDGPRNPFLGILLATTHPNNPAQRLTREQAVSAYTRGAAYAEFTEDTKGTIAPGMLADLAVLSQDIFTVPPGALPATTSVLTMLGGRVVHDARAPGRPR
jgi:predicted amidohydrolase YtcJ